MFLAHAYDVDSSFYYEYYNGSNTTTYKIQDPYNLTQGDNLWLVGPSTNYTLKISANPDFVVSISVDKGDDDWKTYDGNTDYIDLNEQLDARIKVEVTNNSGQDSNGYTIYIPIPKAGENPELPSNSDDYTNVTGIDSGGWKDAFTWSMNLEEEITGLASGYVVQYATDYLVDNDKREIELISQYRQLDPEEKGEVRGLVRGFCMRHNRNDMEFSDEIAP